MRNFLLMTALAGVLTLPGCSIPQMAVDSSFKQQAQELPVEGRKAFNPNGNFRIGAYTVADVHRGWRNSGGFSILGYENVRSRQKYEFSLQDGNGSAWYVFGASKLHEKNLHSNSGITIRVAPNLEYYASHFTSPESGQWQLLTVDPGHYLERQKFAGELSNGSTTYQVMPVYKAEGKSLPLPGIIGYEFRSGEEVLGAVQVMNNGKVWVKPGLAPDTQMVLASAMASLLLYEKLNDPAFEPDHT